MKSKSKEFFLPIGFQASGVSAQIKKSGKSDLALLYSQEPCVASGMFTTNRVKAAPVLLDIRLLKAKKAVRAIVINSGNANCMTGQQGVRDASLTARAAARQLGVAAGEVLVSSTGIIGKPLPMEKILAAMPRLVSELSGKKLKDAAEAILTTDTFAKVVVKKIKIGVKTVTLSGITKGAGMIAPQMKPALPAGRHATMLAYVLTDACVSQKALDKATSEAVGLSFNAITIDGCMSTNDSAIVLANGEAKNALLKVGSKDYGIFACALKEVCLELSKMIIRDAEGATKFIEVVVRGSRSMQEARRLGMSVANSNLFKCAMFGSDLNWGRIAAALGSVASALDWQKMDIALNNRFVFKRGKPTVLKKDKAFLKGKLVRVLVDLHSGRSAACVYTSDLSYEYVRINAEYN